MIVHHKVYTYAAMWNVLAPLRVKCREERREGTKERSEERGETKQERRKKGENGE